MILLRQRCFSLSPEEKKERRKKAIIAGSAIAGTGLLTVGGLYLHRNKVKAAQAAKKAAEDAASKEREEILRKAKEYAEEKAKQTEKDVETLKTAKQLFKQRLDEAAKSGEKLDGEKLKEEIEKIFEKAKSQ